jgi:hypothetical protein
MWLIEKGKNRPIEKELEAAIAAYRRRFDGQEPDVVLVHPDQVESIPTVLPVQTSLLVKVNHLWIGKKDEQKQQAQE